MIEFEEFPKEGKTSYADFMLLLDFWGAEIMPLDPKHLDYVEVDINYWVQFQLNNTEYLLSGSTAFLNYKIEEIKEDE